MMDPVCLVVFCSRPGRHRAGMQHPMVAEYPLDHFSAGQLSELRGDDVFRLAIGGIATEEQLDALGHKPAAAAHKAGKKG